MAKASQTFAVGDRVGYAREFLHNTGQFTGWAPFAASAMLAALQECERTFHAIAIVGSINADGWKHIDKLTTQIERLTAMAKAAGIA